MANVPNYARETRDPYPPAGLSGGQQAATGMPRSMCSIREALDKYASQLERDSQRLAEAQDRLSHILGHVSPPPPVSRPTDGPKAVTPPTIATEIERISNALDGLSATLDALERLT